MSRAATKRSLRRTAMRRGSELVAGTVTILLQFVTKRAHIDSVDNY